MNRLPTASPPSNETWEYGLSLPHQSLGVGVARNTIRSVLTRHALPGLADTAELLTSELCGNAYRHADGPVHVSVRWHEGTLHVGVRDGSSVLPCPSSASTEPQGGRGLLLVSECAAAWGSRMLAAGDGKVTWFELRR